LPDPATLALYDGAVTDLALTVGDVTVVTATPGDAETFRLGVQDASTDNFAVSQSAFPVTAGFRIHLALIDSDATVFESIDLPTTLDLAEFETRIWRVFESSPSVFNELTINVDAFEVVGGEPVDTDNDGLDDATEIEMADGGDCPDPLDPDSDGDTLLDGDEVDLGTDPCNPDSDGDGIPDDLDPFPTDPEGTSGFVEDELRDLAAELDGLDLSLFDTGNGNRARGRRNAMSNKAGAAANGVAAGGYAGAIEQLESLLAKVDGAPEPPDWMIDSPEKEAIEAEILALIVLLEFLV
jgi:hypothetical protein